MRSRLRGAVSTILVRLRAATFISLLWGLFGGLAGASFEIVMFIIRGSSGTPLGAAMLWAFKLFGALGLAFGVAFAVVFIALGRILTSGHVPTWLSALVGGLGAPLGGAILLGMAGSMFLVPWMLGVMAVLGTLIGSFIGHVANRAELPALGSASPPLLDG